MKFTKAQILALVAPAVSIASGALAAWLFVHIHFLGIFHIHQSQAATDIASGAMFAITAGLVWLSHHQHFVPLTTARLAGGAPNKFTIAEVIAFLTPYASIAAGAVAAWLFVHVHFLGIFHFTQPGVAQTIASALVFGVSAVITWAAHNFHWLPLKLAPVVTVVGTAPHKPKPKVP